MKFPRAPGTDATLSFQPETGSKTPAVPDEKATPTRQGHFRPHPVTRGDNVEKHEPWFTVNKKLSEKG